MRLSLEDISLEGVCTLLFEALLRGLDSTSSGAQWFCVVVLAALALLAIIGVFFLSLRIFSRHVMSDCGLLCWTILSFCVCGGSAGVSFYMFVHNVKDERALVEFFALYAIFVALILFMWDRAEDARARRVEAEKARARWAEEEARALMAEEEPRALTAEEETQAQMAEEEVKPCLWAVICAFIVLLELFFKYNVAVLDVKGAEAKSILQFLLRRISADEKYAAKMLFLHACISIAGFMVFHLKNRGLGYILGKVVSVVVFSLGVTQWIFLLIKPSKMPYFFDRVVPDGVSPSYLVFCLLYYVGGFGILQECWPYMRNELVRVWLAVIHLYEDGATACRNVRDKTRHMFIILWAVDCDCILYKVCWIEEQGWRDDT